MKIEMCICLGSPQAGDGGSMASGLIELGDEDAEVWDFPPGSQASEDEHNL